MNILRYNEPKLYDKDRSHQYCTTQTDAINAIQLRQKEPHRTTQRELTNTIQHGQN